MVQTYKLTEAAQERVYMMRVRDLQKLLGAKNVKPKPFSEVIRRFN